MVSAFTRLLASALLFAALSACGDLCLTQDQGDLQVASYWDYDYDPRGSKPPRLPPDTWVRNPYLESFLRTTIEADGIAALTTRYGFQCTPRASTTTCSDCSICSKTIPFIKDDRMFFVVHMCIPVGSIQMQVEIGPGTAVAAMSYRKTGNRPPRRLPPER